MRALGDRQPAIWGLIVLMLIALPSGARAQPPALAEIYEAAKAELAAERYGAAARSFAKGYARAPAGPMRWRMALGLALSHELDGELASAAEHYILFLDLSREHPAAREGKWAERRRRARRDRDALIDELGPSYARLRLETVPPGAEVLIDGEPRLQKTPATLVLEVGEHRVSLRLEGHVPQQLSVSLEPAERMRVQRALPPTSTETDPSPDPEPTSPPPGPPEAPEPVETTVPRTPGGDRLRTVAGSASLGLGGASLILAGVFTAMTAGAVGELNDLAELDTVTDADLARDRELRDRLAWLQPSYVSLYAVGALATATGLVLLLWPRGEAGTADLRLRLAPAGAALSGRF